jgi:hypothetical protein
MYVRLLMVDGLAPGEREETDTKEGERMIVGKGRSTVVVVINYLPTIYHCHHQLSTATQFIAIPVELLFCAVPHSA